MLDYGVSGRGDRDPRQRLDVLQLLRVDANEGCFGRFAGGEIGLADGGDAHGAVDVGHVGYVHVVDLDVDYSAFVDVGDVDLVDVRWACRVPGVVGFAGTEREPDGYAASAELDAAGKDDLGGRPDGMAFARTGNPAQRPLTATQRP